MAKILYWVNGTPTLDQRREAETMGAILRNRKAWHSRDCVESCDAVAGDAPPPYADHPRAEVPKPAKKPVRRSVSRRGRVSAQPKSESLNTQDSQSSPPTPPLSESGTA